MAGFEAFCRDAPWRKGWKGIGGRLIHQCVGFSKKRVVGRVDAEAFGEAVGFGHAEHGGDDDDGIERVLGTEIDLDPADGVGLGCEAAVEAGVLLRLGCGKSGKLG